MSVEQTNTGTRAWRVRTVVIAVVAACVVVALGVQAVLLIKSSKVVAEAGLAGLIAALATALGTLPVFFSQRLSDRTQDALFGSVPA